MSNQEPDARARHFILGTAGHIDHGKSTLVHTLTGTDPDRLPEEKARGMTIELGFAHLGFDDPEGSGTRLELGIVDVPGHADFVRNMVAGVGSIDVALFVVAADDSWMPQSEEHLQILEYLDVRRCIIALTKADLAEDLDFVIEDLRTYLSGTVLENAPIIPTSAPDGTGLEEIKAELARCLRDVAPPRDAGKPRLPIDRVFSPTGVGTIVTGTLAGGTLHVGDKVIIQPVGVKARVRAIQNHNRAVGETPPGTRTALNLPDAPIASRGQRNGVRRGHTVTVEALGDAVLTADVSLTKSDREIPGQPGALRALRDGQPVRCHHGSGDFPARVFFLGERKLAPGGAVLGELRFDTPVHVIAGDRFVLRDWGKQSTIAGGVVLDPDASPRRFRKPHQRAFLEAGGTAGNDAKTAILNLLSRDTSVTPDSAFVKTAFSKDEINQAIAGAVAAGEALQRRSFLLDAQWWHGVLKEAGDCVRQHHAANPDRASISIASLRGKLSVKLQPLLFDQLVVDLTKDGFVKTPNGVRAADHAPTLPPALAPVRKEILDILAENPIEPPNPKEFAATNERQKVLRFLIEIGEVVDLGEKCAILAGSFGSLRDKIIDRLENGPATASEIREAIGTTRRILIPTLEKLDAEGITLRDGDLRSLKKS